MKKIKFLILALLGITIIPTATNAYDIVNKFNGNYGLLYKEFRGSVLYRCPYTSNIDLGSNPSWQATSSSFPCIPGQNFWNGYNRGQFGEGRFVDINQDVVQYITAIKKKDWNYLPIWVNLQRKFWKFQVEHKNWTVYYDEVKTSNPYQYEVNLKSYDGRYGQLLWWLFLDGLLIKWYSRENGNAYDPGYKTVVVLDTDTWMWYKFDTNISLKEALDTSFISLFYSLYNSSPRGCYQMGIFYWQYSALWYSFSFKNDCPEFDIKQKLEKSLTISQWMRKLFKEESPYYDPNYNVNKILWEVPETTAPSANSAEAYNQCLAYYNSVKTYASYDRNCYKDLLDSNQDIAIRQQITDWDWEWEWPATDNRICNLWKGYKKSYKTKFKDKWSEFLELSSANRLSPHSLNVKDYCWERPKIEENKGFFEGIKDFFTGRTGDPLMIGDDWKNYYAGDFADDWEKLRDLYWKCKWLNKRWLMQSATLTEQEKTQACSDYQSEKTKFLKKWEHATIPKFYGWGLPAAIHGIEQSGIGTGWILEKLKKDVSNSVIWDSFSYVWEELFGRVKGPFYSWYNSVLSLNCAANSIPHIEIMDYIAMWAFALMAFILFKLL